ncbi:MAG TPA: acetylglutamate kinase [Cryomorphaceae bacterium]|nr:acetylglutamate kinase [Cryomorphaceae bacterium]
MSSNPRPVLVFKYGGNAMTNSQLKSEVVDAISSLKSKGYAVVVVHGGGPFIQEALTNAKLESKFIDGQRQTSVEALRHVEQTLKGKVNTELVSLFNAAGNRAVGLSGKDGKTVIAKKRKHETQKNGKWVDVDLGQVGDVERVDPELIEMLLERDFLPVITCIASDKDGADFNINGDLFAGYIAGALRAEQFIVLTDVDGLLQDRNRPESILSNLSRADLEQLRTEGVIQGGMIPKTDACIEAIEAGAKSARIINGTKPSQITLLFENQQTGTLIEK